MPRFSSSSSSRRHGDGGDRDRRPDRGGGQGSSGRSALERMLMSPDVRAQRDHDARLNRLLVHDPLAPLSNDLARSRAQLSTADLRDLHYRDRLALEARQNNERFSSYEGMLQEQGRPSQGWQQVIDNRPQVNVDLNRWDEEMRATHIYQGRALEELHEQELTNATARDNQANASDPYYETSRAIDYDNYYEEEGPGRSHR